jgi:glycine/D-amino acid oxidase-like deaminating enzyme
MSMLKHVAIIGGGTAGWITAGILAADHRSHASDGLKITLIESPNVPSIGVGEGTWPSLRDTLQRIGIKEGEFLRACQASFKQGSRFDGWVDGTETDQYYHPFDAPPGEDDLDLASLWRSAAETSFADTVGSQSTLCRNDRAPKQVQTPPYAAVANYAYHLDAPALAALLRQHCTEKLGVELLSAHVAKVDLSESGDIARVHTDTGQTIAADLYVDCTGGRALLIGETLSAPITDVSHILFNDRALALHVPYTNPAAPISSQTNATALTAGWIWDIALQNRRGIGYVFSSEHTSEEDARSELSSYLKRTAPDHQGDVGSARLLSFKSGFRETPWVKNTVAIGMAQGFVEPLEASAIVMIELSAAMLSDTLPPSMELLPACAKRFNDKFAYRWHRIVDFLKLHYVLSRRSEPYWSAHRDRASWPARLVELMEIWQHMPPSREDFPQSMEIFPAASYAFVLYGMGFEPPTRPFERRKDLAERAQHRRAEIRARTQQLLAGLPSNRELLTQLCDPKIAGAA